MRHLLLTVVLVFISYTGFAQNGILKGNVSDDGQPVSFASVVVTGNDKKTGTSADAKGNYSLNLSPGTYNVTISAVGYRIDRQQVTIQAGETVTLDVALAEDMLGLDQVVVTGSRSEIPSYNAPVVVNRITAKTLDMTQSLSLSEGLNFSPGLRMETNCQNCGFNQLRINGLEGAYSQILINSRPVFSALAGVYGLEMIPANMVDRIEVVKGGGSALYGGNAIGGTVNIITKDPSENTFEIGSNFSFLRGKTPDRTIYVNGSIVSEDLDKGMSFFAYNRDRAPFDANDKPDGFSEITKLKNNTFGADFFWNTTDRSKLKANFNSISEFRRGGNAFDLQPHESDITEQLRHRILGGDISFDISTDDYKHNFTIYASAQNTERNSYYGEGGGEIEGFQQVEDIVNKFKTINLGGTDYNLTQIIEEVEANGDFDKKNILKWVESKFASLSDKDKEDMVEEIKNQNDEREGYYKALNSYGKSTDLSSAVGAQYQYNVNDDMKLSLGSEYQYNHVTDNMPGYGRSIDQKVGTFGNYAQLEWTVVEPLTFLIGGRYDMSKIDGTYKFREDPKPYSINETFHNFVPRATVKYDINEQWKLRSSYAQGYRIPQAFDEDLHVASVQGDAVFTRIPKGLKPEKSDNFTASVNYIKTMGDWQANIVLEGFYTSLKNKFDNTRGVTKSGILQNEKENREEKAVVKGVNLEVNVAYLDKFILQAGATFQSSKYSKEVVAFEDEEDPSKKPIMSDRFLRTPNNYGFFAATYNLSDNWSLNYSGVLTGSMFLIHNEKPVDTPSFFENNVKVSYRFTTKDHYFVEVNTGIQNIFDSYQKDFDSGMERDSEYIYGPVRPRTFFVGLKFGLD